MVVLLPTAALVGGAAAGFVFGTEAQPKTLPKQQVMNPRNISVRRFDLLIQYPTVTFQFTDGKASNVDMTTLLPA